MKGPRVGEDKKHTRKGNKSTGNLITRKKEEVCSQKETS